jgi:teichuronic acid biosynthesis glycosyltransferase TuaC
MPSLLTITTLFPNPVQPVHGAFVAARIGRLLATGEFDGEVIAPVPWLPPLVNYSSLGPLSRVPRKRCWHKVTVHHPRYLVVPKIGMALTPHTLFWTLKRTVEKLLAQNRRFDLIDAHYFYPDGVAAVWVARYFGIPVTVTARGTDLNLIPEYPTPRKMICEAAAQADGLITVCQALKDRLIELGTAPERVTVLRNGVDLELFKPIDRDKARATLGLARRTLGSVGWLIERKGHHHAICALAALPDTDLLIVGEGPERTALERLAAKEGVSERVRFLGRIEQKQLPEIYSAMDALVLASAREGWANVLLEAMACGTPVVASAVWGTPEVVAAPEAGVLMKTVDAQGVIEGVTNLFATYPDRAATRRYAEGFSWDATTQGQLALFRQIIARRQPNNSA